MYKNIWEGNWDLNLLECLMRGDNTKDFKEFFKKFNFKKLRVGRFKTWKYVFNLFLDKDADIEAWVKNVNPDVTSVVVFQRLETFCKEIASHGKS